MTKKEFRSPKTTKINSFPISFDNIVLEKYYNYVIQKIDKQKILINNYSISIEKAKKKLYNDRENMVKE
ncbi:hypothetical protein SAG0162_11435 [Streptococcus agalactiae MRI Z1-214]|uniref:Uncharacterized protein n=2 Tax=Streptococcus agalactiae TaxID=1311 RepID=A0AAD3A4Y4_STRAG|nr:hypothetical protein FSLSAGS3026_01573 [Streptococcus agalactiae FSL S3-026]EPU37619.1 hypothetical protein SAG0161_12145 [Streptococcus agalactiae MRI Z1-213]EPU40238.1 hypothetical protein SAG0162_11435 [Streptococcus agalactiae MRI Z1-214]EPU43501.1 hypothetical protein SAG0164_12430 [Streptococcus agalactiae MRI Z1-216]EPV89273.1 hypothetical protein SAG0014_09510 [Streptococcus agalactiae FSL S3-586]EPX04246.1 hypothetical protein SAG0165_00020 [Streptococcus agalactiae MRI Z1-217]KLL